MTEYQTRIPSLLNRINSIFTKRLLTILTYGQLGIAGIALITLLVVFPMVGTEDGTYMLYAMRRTIPVTYREYVLVMGLFASVLAGLLGAALTTIIRLSIDAESHRKK